MAKTLPPLGISYAQGMQVQEERLERAVKKQKLVIGIPKELDLTENRVALTPEAVELLVREGLEVLVETKAGAGVNFSNLNYAEMGAQIVETPQEVFRSDIILKIAPLVAPEIQYVRENQLIFSSLRLEPAMNTYLHSLMHKKVTAVDIERIVDSDGTRPVVDAMSAIAGSTSIIAAAEFLSNVNAGKGVMLGGVPGVTPTEVVILGAGTVAEFAARAALGLGAVVKVFDFSVKRLNDLQIALGQRLFTSTFHPRVLERVLKTADVVIGNVSLEESKGRHLISKEQIENMKSGSLIIDLCIDRGGCFETSEMCSHNKPSFVNDRGVTHYCVPNITSRVGRTASIALSNVFVPLLINMAEYGGFTQFVKHDQGFRQGVYLLNGILTNQYLGDLYNVPSRDINLLLAAF